MHYNSSLPSPRLPSFCSWLTPSLQTPLATRFFPTTAFLPPCPHRQPPPHLLPAKPLVFILSPDLPSFSSLPNRTLPLKAIVPDQESLLHSEPLHSLSAYRQSAQKSASIRIALPELLSPKDVRVESGASVSLLKPNSAPLSIIFFTFFKNFC